MATQVHAECRMELVAACFETKCLAEGGLIQELSVGNPKALAAAYDLYSRAVYSLVVRITCDQQAAEDLVHELFVGLWNRRKCLDSMKGTLRVWLLQSARDMAIAHTKARSTRLTNRFEAIAELNGTRLDPKPDEAELKAALLTLSEPQRQVLELAYFQGRSQADIAAILAQPPEKVKLWMSTAFGHLRAALKRTMPAAPNRPLSIDRI